MKDTEEMYQQKQEENQWFQVNGEGHLNVHRVSFWGNEYILELAKNVLMNFNIVNMKCEFF